MKRILYEAPIDDFISKESMEKINVAQIRKYNTNKTEGGSSYEMGNLMRGLPNKEAPYKRQLVQLAIDKFLENFYEIKEKIDEGLVSLDVQISTTPAARRPQKKVTPEEIEQAQKKDPLFNERIKGRNFQNAITQGNSWNRGFDFENDKEFLDDIEDIINYVDSTQGGERNRRYDDDDEGLVEKYKKFGKSATVFYNDNLAQLESMAKNASGVAAYCEIVNDPTNPKAYILVVRAPNFPLLMHELEKVGEDFLTYLYMSKDKVVKDALVKTTDVHDHEIRNMLTGKQISLGLNYHIKPHIDTAINQFIKEKRLPTNEKGEVTESTIKKYERWLYNIIIKNFNKLANDEILMYNMIMYDGIIDGKNKVKFEGEMVNPMEYFDEFIEMIIYGGDGNKGAVDVLPIMQTTTRTTTRTTTTTTTQKYEPPTYDFDDEDDDDDDEPPTDDIDDEDGERWWED
jgi:hypothetical protein